MGKQLLPKTIVAGGKLIEFSSPLVMGILNVTPDSFFSGSRKQSETEIIDRVRQIVSEGGSFVDVGAQSTRPGAEMLSCEEEMNRLRFSLEIINREFQDVAVSVDTFYADVAKCCVEEYGAVIVNDVSGGQLDEKMFATVADLHVPYVLMHMRGTPQTMSSLTDYNNLIQDIFYYFSEKVARLHALGVNDVIIDPGFGFSKNLEQNYRLLSALPKFSIFGLPLLVGISRKGMIGKVLGNEPDERLNGTTVLNTFAAMNGADILRVHDVKEAVEVVRLTDTLKQYL